MTTLSIEKNIRMPWGMRSWLFWVLTLFVAGLVGNIPYVGEPILFVLLIVAFVFWVRQPTVPHTKVVHIPDSGLFRHNNRQEVVGESFYQDEIEGFVARNGRKTKAVLIHEPKNPHSPSGTAVRIDLFNGQDIVTCGYLPESVSPKVAPNLKVATKWKHPYIFDADIRGGWESAPNYGVWLVKPGAGQPPRKKAGPRFEKVSEVDLEEVKDFWSKQTPKDGAS